MKNILITGGLGFIGSHVVRLFVNKYPDYNIVNVDAVTYAGNPENLTDIEKSQNYTFIQCDIRNKGDITRIFEHYNIDGVIHLAAESHVDNSISSPDIFIQTNVNGTFNLLEAARKCWGTNLSDKMFYHVSTDEVYGALKITHLDGIEPPFSTKASSKQHVAYGKKFFTEKTKYDPHSPYSASKASSDHLVRSYHDTYGLPTIVTNCSNNYGPNQFPEKLIPLFISNIIQRKPLPVYGNGINVRDWLYVEDHARAIDLIFHNAKPGSTYNIGGFNEWKNIDVITTIIDTVDEMLGREEGEDRKLITYVTDRAGHDARYAIDSRKLQRELGWEPQFQFEDGIRKTVQWYLDNTDWIAHIKDGSYNRKYRE